jgi:ribokinase
MIKTDGSRVRVVVVGSANVDLTTFTDQFPRPGETIFGRSFDLGFGGKGANQAVAARLCGAEVAMVARVGDDMFGAATIANFKEFGIDTGHVHITPGVSSGVAPIFVESSGQNRIIVVKGANDLLVPTDVDRAEDLLRAADCIVLQLEVPVETVYYTLRFARRHGIRTILNPAPAQTLDLQEAGQADYLIPNETEAETIAGMPVRNLDDARECAQWLLGRGLRRVIVTLGPNGALCAGSDGMRHLAPFVVNAMDTSGAGDAFIGSFAYFIARGFGESEAVSRSNLYAALSTLSVGTQKSFVTRERFEAAWRNGSAVAFPGDTLDIRCRQ